MVGAGLEAAGELGEALWEVVVVVVGGGWSGGVLEAGGEWGTRCGK